MPPPLIASLGPCPICGRDMLDDGFSTNRHHLVPKCRGGRATEWMHRICHNFLHKRWSEKQLEREYSDPALIRADPEAQAFIAWVSGKRPDFYSRTATSNAKKRGR